MPPSLEISDILRSTAIVAGAQTWLDDLPDLVTSIERDWSITVGRALSGGTEAFVAEATMHDGTPAVLKVLVPRYDAAAQHEINALRLADGHGCARLFRDDVAAGALLLERLGPALHTFGFPLQQRLEILCTAAEAIWRPASGCGFPTGAEKGRWLIDYVTGMWKELGPAVCAERAVTYAIECAERRIAAHHDERSVLVHGDVHQWNALQAHDGFKLVDPDGLLAEAEYDMAILMREDPRELLEGDPHERARWLAHRTGLDESAIWEWGVIERVSTGLLCTNVGLQPSGREMLEVADRIAQ